MLVLPSADHSCANVEADSTLVLPSSDHTNDAVFYALLLPSSDHSHTAR